MNVKFGNTPYLRIDGREAVRSTVNGCRLYRELCTQSVYRKAIEALQNGKDEEFELQPLTLEFSVKNSKSDAYSARWNAGSFEICAEEGMAVSIAGK